MTDLDAILAELTSLRERLASMPGDDPQRSELEERRSHLHALSRRHADLIRPSEELRRELENAKQRLAQLDAMQISPSYTERRQERWPIGNPTGYFQKINSAISDHTEDERTVLVERIAEIAQILDDR